MKQGCTRRAQTTALGFRLRWHLRTKLGLLIPLFLQLCSFAPSAFAAETYTYDALGGAELTPFGESSGTALFENRSVVEASVLVEVVEDGGTDGGEFLQTSHLPEARHRPFSSSQRLM